MDNDTVTIDISITAPVENVWKALTDSALISKWFGSDPNGKVMKADLDVRIGGAFEVTFRDADQTEHTCSGIYVDVKEFSKLSFSWTWKSEPGVQTFVTVALSSEKNLTRMIFQHAHPGTASKHDYLNGWNATFVKLEQMLTGKKAI
ncbi:MAG: SRPBCC domain-containing protein [Chitinophagaceae bacterium]|nr:SRPBCC domain-containing protein [Chitinophagaceae bacterium]